MIHSYHFDGAVLRQNVPVEEWRALMSANKGLFWVDMEDPTEDEIDYLTDIFGFHDLTVEDCIFPNHRPKVDDYTDYLFIIFHAMALKNGVVDANNLQVLELQFYLGNHYLVTFHEDPILLVNQTRTRVTMHPALMAKGSDFLLHLIMDAVVDEMTRILDRMEDKLDVIEDRILADEVGALQEMNEFKAAVSKFRKFAGPHRDVIRALMSQSFEFISDRRVIYFKDIHDHLVSINESANLFRELMASTLESYLSMVQKKMNDVMKVLTVFTVIFMPLNLIAGIGGMSEFTMMTGSGAHNWIWAYAAFSCAMFLIGWAVYVALKKKGMT